MKREIEEEVGLGIKNINYVTSMVYVRPDNIPCLIVSLYAEPDGGLVRLCPALTDFKWVSLEEAKKYELIEGIYHELEILDKFLKKGQSMEWKSEKV